MIIENSCVIRQTCLTSASARFRIEERKKPPPRPSAPKPKLKAPSKSKAGAVEPAAPEPGAILSPEMLAKMMAEDDDELLNDPEFLQFLRSQGGCRLGKCAPWDCSNSDFVFRILLAG